MHTRFTIIPFPAAPSPAVASVVFLVVSCQDRSVTSFAPEQKNALAEENPGRTSSDEPKSSIS